MKNKNKIYVRRWKCAICGKKVIARYNKFLKGWSIECGCGKDVFKNISIFGSFECIDNTSYPID